MWPWTEFGICDAEAGATLWIGMLAGIIAIWGVITQRAIARRQVTMELMTRAESDKDLIAARTRYIALTEKMGALVALADGAEEVEKRGAAERKGDATEASELRENIAAVRLLFNHLELIAIGIQLGIVDYEIYRRFAKSSVVKDWDRGAPLVYALRQKYNQESMYHEFEELARWLRGSSMPRRRRIMSLWR